MAEQINRRLNIYIDAAGAEKALDRLTAKETELTASIEKSKKAGKDFTTQMQQLANTRQQMASIKDVLDGKVLPSLNQAESAVKRLRNELRQMPADTAAAAAKFQEFKKAEATLAQVKNQFQAVSKETRGFGSIVDTAFGVFLGGGLLNAVISVGSRMKEFLVDSTKEALTAEENSARLKATLDNIGRGDAFDKLKKSANDLATQFKFLDNDDIVAVFEKLITYGKLTEAQIQKLTPVIIDFASKQRIALPEATTVVIKALEGNSKALKEYGIDMKDAKTVTEAFGLLMTDLKPRVEGAAKTFGEETAGQIATTRQQIRELQEDIGTQLLPALKVFLQFVNKSLTGIYNIARAAKDAFNSQFNTVQLVTDKAMEVARLEQDRVSGSFLQMTGEEQDAQIDKSRARLRRLGKALRDTANEDQKAAFTQLFNQEAAFQLQIKNLQRSQSLSGNVLGLGGDMNLGNTGSEQASAAKKAAEELARLKKEWASFYQKITVEGTAVDAPILAAFIELNNKIKEQLDQVAEYVKKGIITPAQAKEATHLIQQIYEGQAEAIRKKFNQERIPIKVDPPDMDRDLEYGLEQFAAKVKKQLENGLKEQTKSQENPISKWLAKTLPGSDVTNGDAISIWSQQTTDAIQSVHQIRMSSEQMAFDLEMANLDRKKIADKRALDGKLISQKEYDKRVAKIEEQQAARQLEFRRKQFKQEQAMQTVQAVMNTAQAVMATLEKFGPPIPPNIVGIAAMAFTVATSAIQLAAIRSAKPPQFAEGGFVPNGPSHAAGGISLVDNRSGSKVGEVEGGEPILSRATYRQNRPLIDALLNASQSNGGRFAPSWASMSPQSMNIPRISSSINRVNFFADGGIIPTTPGTEGGNEKLLATLNALMAKLDQPFQSYVSLNDFQTQSARLNTIRRNGMIN